MNTMTIDSIKRISKLDSDLILAMNLSKLELFQVICAQVGTTEGVSDELFMSLFQNCNVTQADTLLEGLILQYPEGKKFKYGIRAMIYLGNYFIGKA